MNKMLLTTLFDGIMPNTEVTTNLPLHVKAERVREFGLTLDAGNCVSNEVLVAIGCDADGNGDLSFEETAFVFGCDCGERYLVDYVSGTAALAEPRSNRQSRCLFTKL